MRDQSELQFTAGEKPASLHSEVRICEERIQLLREVLTAVVTETNPSGKAKLLSILAIVNSTDAEEPSDGS